jgi:hypothetical protein
MVFDDFVLNIQQYFDAESNYDRFDFQGDQMIFGNVTLAFPMTVIHDFNTGDDKPAYSQ